MTRLNSYVDPVRTQVNNTQNMNKYDTSTQKTHNLHVCSTENSESKRIKSDERKSHICSTIKSGEIKLSPMHVIWMKENQKLFTSVSIRAM